MRMKTKPFSKNIRAKKKLYINKNKNIIADQRGLNQESENPGSRLSRTTQASGSIERISLYELYTFKRCLRDIIKSTCC